jgi:HprK-related kinase B
MPGESKKSCWHGVKDVLSHFDPVCEEKFFLPSFNFALKSNNPVFLEAIKTYLGPWETASKGSEGAFVFYAFEGKADIDCREFADYPPKKGDTPKESYCDTGQARIILKRRIGMVHFIENKTIATVGNILNYTNQYVNMINEIYIDTLASFGYIPLHASGVSDGENVIIFTSPSGMGKTTLALQMLERGFKFVSNDRILICVDVKRRRFEVVGAPKIPRINPGTVLAIPRLHGLMQQEDLERYLTFSYNKLWNIERKFDVNLSEFYGTDALSLDGKLKGIVLLDWKPRRGETKIEKLDWGNALNSLERYLRIESVFRQRKLTEKEISVKLTAISQNVPSFRVTGKANPELMAELISENWANPDKWADPDKT